MSDADHRAAGSPPPAERVTAARKQWRKRLLEERKALSPRAYQTASIRICLALGEAVRRLFPQGPHLPSHPPIVVSGYHPIQGEPDPALFVERIVSAGFRYALPVGTGRHEPLRFLEWSPGTPLEPGLWGILGPAPSAPALRPDLIVAPVVGYDRKGYRLGYGGGYFDRTFAALAQPQRPFFVGAGFATARLDSIDPQPQDYPMDALATDEGLLWF